jgi:hydroxymethylpyrimidine/phosphomethylpyrimidine kinase
MPARCAPVALTIAGSDNSGGAGIQADLKTFTSLGVYGTSAITCVVAENPRIVESIHPVPPKIVRRQIELVFDAYPVAAIKTGMLYSEAIIREVVAFYLSLPLRKRPPLVVDPVMVATSGALLFKKAAMRALMDELLPLATVVTPNLDETAVLLGRKLRTLDEAREAAIECRKKWGIPFLIKGGHLNLPRSTDFLAGRPGGVIRLSAKTVRGIKTHGTGCTYSSAITARLAHGDDLPDAVRTAKKFITRAIRDHLKLGPEKALNHLPA